jgi:Zn-dependent protease with chaperone function
LVDAGTLYLKVFLGAKAFTSSEMDSLAESMGVSPLLSGDEERYFLTKTNVTAFSFGNKLLFGARYYGRLTESQRLAVAAHEFGHVLGDGGERRKRLVLPAISVSALMAILIFLGMGSMVALVCASLLALMGATLILSSLGSDRYLRHEMSCDRLAASFADGQALVEAIRAAEALSLEKARMRRLASIRRRVGTRPSTNLRVDAILGLKGSSQNG